MDRNLRLLGLGLGFRALGLALCFPFLSLFLYNVLGISYLEIGGLLAGIGLAQIPFSFAGGLVADRYPRRIVILAGLFGEGAATLGLAYSMALRSLTGALAFAVVGGALANVAY
ncbi:MAG: hypothetical protein L3K17_03215, partial [Thermoplasmata archaeon]|nr:hypothetical protein [Thermoplasmata archaeon]